MDGSSVGMRQRTKASWLASLLPIDSVLGPLSLFLSLKRKEMEMMLPEVILAQIPEVRNSLWEGDSRPIS
jgi:hypothetical protein